jgi:hypothetical protein
MICHNEMWGCGDTCFALSSAAARVADPGARTADTDASRAFPEQLFGA